MELKQTTAPKGAVIEVDIPKSSKPAYEAPVLKGMGDIRLLTLGASPGATESGGGSISRKPAGT